MVPCLVVEPPARRTRTAQNHGVENLDRYASNSAIFRPASMAAHDGGSAGSACGQTARLIRRALRPAPRGAEPSARSRAFVVPRSTHRAPRGHLA